MTILRIFGWYLVMILSIIETGIITFSFTKEGKEDRMAGTTVGFIIFLILAITIALLGLLDVCH